MGDQRSIESQRAEFRRWGSPDLGTSNPLIHKGTQLATRFLQKGSRAAVTRTGTLLHFSPAFSGTPLVFLKARGAIALVGGSIQSPLMKNVSRSGGTIGLAGAGTLVVDYLAIDPSV